MDINFFFSIPGKSLQKAGLPLNLETCKNIEKPGIDNLGKKNLEFLTILLCSVEIF